MMPPPSFVIRNSVHTTTTDDIVVGVPPIDGHAGEDGVKQIGDVVESSMSIRPPSVPVVVQLVQATEGAYMLDFDFANDTLIANIISKKDEDNPNNDETYIDEEAWEHLLAYSELVGKPISIDKNELEVKHPHNVVSPALSTNASSFVLLKDVAKESRTRCWMQVVFLHGTLQLMQSTKESCNGKIFGHIFQLFANAYRSRRSVTGCLGRTLTR
jgi:hypothetical protein